VERHVSGIKFNLLKPDIPLNNIDIFCVYPTQTRGVPTTETKWSMVFRAATTVHINTEMLYAQNVTFLRPKMLKQAMGVHSSAMLNEIESARKGTMR
jgi:hypothetical protein